MTTEFFPEQTIRYKTYAKRTLQEGLTKVFANHPDDLIHGTKASIEYPKTEIDYPCVVIRFFEREIFNAGVGHIETTYVNGESDSIEVSANLNNTGSVQLSWGAIENATGYKVYKGTASNQEAESFTVVNNVFFDNGLFGSAESVPTVVTADLDSPSVSVTVGPPGQLRTGQYFYRVTALAPSEAIRFQHYFYTADIEFAVYALSSYDRDLIADSLIQTIAMGKLEAYTNTLYERIYPSNDLIPDSDLHFIALNSDQIQGFGESQAETPWGAEDDLLYTTSYRVGIFGELYSLPPKLSFALVRKVTEFPYISGLESVPSGSPGDDGIWVSNDLSFTN